MIFIMKIAHICRINNTLFVEVAAYIFHLISFFLKQKQFPLVS